MVLVYDFGSGDFEFEPTYTETRYALKHILKDYSREKMLEILDDAECKDYTKEELVETILDRQEEVEDCFEDELWQYFESDASSEYEDNCEYQRDMYRNFGLRY